MTEACRERGHIGPPTPVQEATAEEDQRVLTALGSGQVPVAKSKGIERVTQKMSNLFFHQRMIFWLPDETPSLPLPALSVACM